MEQTITFLLLPVKFPARENNNHSSSYYMQHLQWDECFIAIPPTF